MYPQNILFGFLPETVNVSGKEYFVNTDFRTWLYIGEIVSSGNAPERCLPVLLSKGYRDEIPPNTYEAVSALTAFYKNAFPKYKGDGKGAQFSADFDGPAIFSGFMKNYGIDLSADNLHWYRFAPLLTELSDCIFSKALEVRSTDLSKLKPDMRKAYAKIKKVFSLPKKMPDEQNFADELYSIF